MCGLAGVIGNQSEDLVRRMTAALAHRGPDDEAYYSDEKVALGFRRLSIVDIGGGRQPITSESGDLVLVCNGEIYNSPSLRADLEKSGHRFRTKSDVEVILHLYEDHGLRCLQFLEGMFAFAIWDVPHSRLVLARDHMGQKPLFYYHQGENFYFASEIQALLKVNAIKRKLDLNALWHYLSLRFMPDHYSLIDGIRKLPAANYLVFENDRIVTQRYWHLDFRQKLNLSTVEAIEAIDEQLQRAVNSHLMSDVTVGSFISGGIDSTTVASMMAKMSAEQVPVFSIGVKEAGFDELPAAQRVADINGLEFYGERVQPDIASLIPVMVHHLGEPADAYGVGIFLVAKLAAQHVKVALCGDGGDESFGGYDRYLGQRLVDLYCMLPRTLRRAVLSGLIATVPETFRYKSLAQRLKWLRHMSEYSGGERYAQALGFLRFTNESKHKLFTEQAIKQMTDTDSTAQVLRFFDTDSVTELTDRMLYTDLMTRVSDHNLVMTDRMSMASSLEVRSPFVDRKIVEFAATLPVDMKVRGRQLKFGLREVARRYIPQDVAGLPKQGFGFPVGKWMRNELRHAVENRLMNSRFVAAGLFREDYLDQLLTEHVSGHQDHSYRLWLLLSLEIWHELYLEGNPLDSVELAT